jgi:hypothetical protein
VAPETLSSRRHFARLSVSCRARIRIGTRQYFGYLENISQGGARLRTVSPIRERGPVYLRLPDLPPLCGEVRWTEPYTAGVSFELALSRAELCHWAQSRLWCEQLDDAPDRTFTLREGSLTTLERRPAHAVPEPLADITNCR